MNTGGKPSGPPDTRLRLREQILNDQKLLTVGRGGVNKMKPYTFGSLLPNSIEQAERLSSKRRQRSGESLKVTDLLENIRTKGNRVRMDFITQRMGILRGEAPTTDTSSLLNIIKNNIRANSSRSQTEKTPLVTNFSNLLDFSGRQTFKNIQQKEEATKNLTKGMRFINKLDDNEMLKLIKAEEKNLGITISKPNERIWRGTNLSAPQPPQTIFEINGLNKFRQNITKVNSY